MSAAGRSRPQVGPGRRTGQGLVVGAALSAWLAAAGLYQVMILSAGLAAAGLLLVASGLMQKGGRHDNGFVTILNDFQDMPHTMRQLAWVQFFSWFALFAMWIYTTAAVTSHVYHTTDTASALYNEGANWVGILFAAYNGFAALAALLIPKLADTLGRVRLLEGLVVQHQIPVHFL